ncbi:MAG: hypothetical protein I8H77_17490 [Comamonadaceae bacterium]|nr:hypothetical protein [Comamonadaceae bacterium]
MNFSFDVFDTCITRMHAYPRDLFFDLGLRLAPITSNEADRHSFARRFQRARIRAEKLANWRARPEREHSDIFAIYDNLRPLMRLDRTSLELVEAELALEEESIYPIPETVRHINELRHAGHRILFVSDMYLPSRFLRPLLLRKQVMQMEDDLYVSCDHGVTKHSGKLFARVLQQERLAGPDLIHTGDNRHADINQAEANGISTRYFSAAHLIGSEAHSAGSKLPRTPVGSWLAGFSRRYRLAMRHSGSASHPLDSVIVGTVLPFLLAYVQWVLNDARQRGIKRLYFVARDGEVLFKIAKELNPEGIELRYLYGSRRAWLAPSIVDHQPEWKRLLAVSGSSNAPKDILARAGLRAEERAELRVAFGIDNSRWERSLGLQEADAFIEKLTTHPRASELLRASAHDKRQFTLRYFKQEGLLDDTAWAFVDSGWSLNSQAAVKRIFDSAGIGLRPPQGYYIGLARDHLNEVQAGKAYAFVTPPGSIFSRRRVVIEHCFLPSTHSSTRGYKLTPEEVVPDFSEEARDENEIAYACHLHDCAVKAARLVADNADLQSSLRRFAPDLRERAAYFVCNPSYADAVSASHLTAVADMRQERAFAQPLCRSLRAVDVWETFRMAFSRGRSFKSNAWMWLEGSAALSSPLIRLPIRLMLWADRMKHQLQRRNSLGEVDA